jgi:hypothetical protein
MERLAQRLCLPSELGNPQRTRVPTFPQRRRLRPPNRTNCQTRANRTLFQILVQNPLLNGDLLSGRPSQQALHDWPIGFAFCQGRGISILVHCGGDVRVSHEFLLNAHGCSRFVQPSTVGVAERVEPDSAKSQLKTCRNQVVGTNRIGVIRPTGHRTEEVYQSSQALRNVK